MFKKVWLARAMLFLPLAAMAGQEGTKVEPQAMAKRAAALYDANRLDSLIAALSDSSTGEFHDRDLYVFVFDTEGNTVAHGANDALLGRTLIGLRDVEGHEFARSFVETVQTDDQGWVDYIWQNPQTKAPERKPSYFTRIDDNLLLGVGV
ncbi:cache domain-containing protein [Roseobacter sinensis]|uniref:Cache domain-containing protein n=1 Tax=Roseobacter sinensis TaxID=2931391 RepID=A0ABT3BJX4_9RHOB|nr:cache domain-containing protein [Roseobacter sp. WL0113]MCV3273874.1 cache domain-containing protein [Roseobacter sp. WL0113]